MNRFTRIMLSLLALATYYCIAIPNNNALEVAFFCIALLLIGMCFGVDIQEQERVKEIMDIYKFNEFMDKFWLYGGIVVAMLVISYLLFYGVFGLR